MANITSSIQGGRTEGTNDADSIRARHSNNTIYAYMGNDTILVESSTNSVSGGGGNDLIMFQSWTSNNVLNNRGDGYYNGTYYYGLDGNDTIITAGNNSEINDYYGSNYFVSGGTNNKLYGNGSAIDNFFVYSYEDTANVTLAGGSNTEDNFTISTGYTEVEADEFLYADFKSSTNETINVTITDFDSLDNLTVINSGMTALYHSVGSAGTYLFDNTGQINIYLKGVTNWDNIKRASFKYGTGNGALSTTTLERSTLLPDSNPETTIKIPSGISNVITSSIQSGKVESSNSNDYIIAKHSNNTIRAYMGNDTIAVYSSNNSVSGGGGNDLIMFQSWTSNNVLNNRGDGYYNGTYYYGLDGNDTIITAGNNSEINDYYGNNYFISGGTNNKLYGNGSAVDSFFVYSYNDTANVTLTGGANTEDNFTISTGYVGVEGTDFLDAEFNGATNETINTTITDLDSLDALTVINSGMTAIYHSVGSAGTYLFDNTGQINIYLKGVTDWNSIKRTQLTYSNDSENFSTTTLDKATLLPGTSGEIPQDTQPASSLEVIGTKKAEELNNSLDNATISGAAGNDTITNSGNYVTISGGADNDSIKNSGAYVTISGDEGKDSINNSGANVRIYGNDGNDYIYNSGNSVYIDAGAGNDTIHNTGKNVTIVGGAGGDNISLSSAATGTLIKYTAGDGDDSIYGFDSNDTLQISGETFSTMQRGSDILISLASGSLWLKSVTTPGKITGSVSGGGTDTGSGGGDTTPADTTPAGWKITSTLATASLTSAANLDLTQAYGEKIKNVNGAKLTSGVVITGNDLNNSIKGGKGADLISGGAGNDTVSLGAGNDTYIYSSGNDLIQDYVAGADVIQIDTTEIEITGVETSSTNIIYATSEGNLTVKGGKDKAISLIDADGNEIEIDDGKGDLMIVGTAKADNIENDLDEATIDALAGNDDITNSGNNVSINAGAGNDNIYNTGDDAIIEGGAGRDSIFSEGYYATISGGAGNDTIENSGGEEIIYRYGQGDGNDIIYGFTDKDTLEITKGTYSYSVSGNDFVVKVGSGTVKLIDAADKAINILDASGNLEVIENSGVAIPAGWKLDSTKNLLQATVASAENEIDLNEAYGEGVTKVDGSKITGGVEIIANDLDNSLKGGKGNDILDGGAGNDTLTSGAGDDLFIYSGGDDYISDYTAGKDSIQIDVTEIEIYSMETVGSNVVYATDAGNITVKSGKGKEITLIDVNGEEIIVGGAKIPDGWQLTNNILKATVASADNEIDLTEAYGDGVQKVDGSKISGGVEIIGNDLNVSLKGGKGNDVLAGGAGNDTLTSGTGDDLFIYTGGDDYITDYTAGKDSIQIDVSEIEIYGVSTVGTNVIYATDAGNITVKSGANKQITLIDADGEEIVIESNAIPTGWQLDSSKKILKATVASAENDIDLTEAYGDGVTKVDGSKITGGVVIFGNDEDNSIKGGRGADTISGGSGNDTVSLGGGADVYIYSGGDDVIQDYVAGTDSIQINTGDIEVENISTLGNDIIYETSAGNIKVVKGKGKNITLMDEDGAEVVIGGAEYPEGWKFDSAKGLLQATISTAADEIDLSESYGAGVEKVDGSKITSGVVIYGSDDNISMKGSKGNDTISGGTGNDTVSLGGGADVYIYNGGNDYIHDYANVDAIQIDTDEIAITGIATVSTNKIIETSEGNITLKSGKTKTLNLIDANGEEISFNGRIAENVWFLEDDNNFVASDIDSITEQKFAVTDIQNYNNETFAQDDNILTFAKEK